MLLAIRPKNHRLHLAPFSPLSANTMTGEPEPARVLDLGHGTAIWMLDMAQKYPQVDFQGIDIANMAPQSLFHNVNARHAVDFESPWALGLESYDLIHMQMGLGSVSNWPLLYDKVLAHLKPGGYFEQVEIDFTPRCEDQSLGSGRLLDWWHRYVKDPFNVVGRPIELNPNTGAVLSAAGFNLTMHATHKIPLNGWPGDRAARVAGTWWDHAMAFGEDRGHGFEALSLAVLTKIQRWPVEHARKLCEEASQESGNPNVRAFNNLHVWVAQKPGRAR